MEQKKRAPQTHYLVTEEYLMTRSAALHFPAKQFNGMLPSKGSVYGMVIDMPMDPRTVATLVVYINGAANLYFNNGGSYTGASQRYQSLVQASRLLVINGTRILPEAKKTKQLSMPLGQPHNIFLLTRNGIYEKQVMPTEVSQESKDVQSVYFLYQQVMRELRSAQLKDRAAAQAQK